MTAEQTYADSDAILRELVVEDPGGAGGYYTTLGVNAEKRGDSRAAEDAYRAAAQVDARLPTPHYNLGLLLARQGRLADAEREIEQALACSPTDPACRLTHARLLLGLYQVAEAKSVFNKAANEGADATSAMEGVMACIAMEGDWRLALSLLEALCTSNPSPDRLVSWSLALAWQSRWSDASNALRRVPDEAWLGPGGAMLLQYCDAASSRGLPRGLPLEFVGKVVEGDGSNPFLQEVAAALHQSVGQTAEARARLAEATKLRFESCRF